MMEEQHLMEYVKDQTVFTAQELTKELAKSRLGEHRLDFVLPDGVSSGSGFVLEPFGREAGNKGQEVQKTVVQFHLII